MSSAYHPQSDGQTEVVNRCIEQFLRCFVQNRPKQWSSLLPWAEFWFNTTYHSSTGTTSFKALYGREPLSIPSYEIGASTLAEVDDQLASRDELLGELKQHLERANNRAKQLADAKRRDIKIECGSWVYLRLQPYRQCSVLRRTSQKLSHKYFGPFQVEAKVGEVAYRLTLPQGSRIHLVFHVSLLKPHVGTVTPTTGELPPLRENGYLHLQPEKVIRRRDVAAGNKTRPELLIKWCGLSDEDATWEEEEQITESFPEFHINLEDKISRRGRGIDGPCERETRHVRWAKIARNNLAANHKLGLIDDPKIQKAISFIDNAKVLWDNLRVRYSIGNASRVHQIKSSIVGCSQDGQDVAEYFGKIKVMWDDLDDYEPFIDCCCSSPTCPQRIKQQTRRDLERIHQFLMGLDASRFGTTRTNILSRLNRDTDMTLDQVYFEVVAEERHLLIARSKEERIEAVGFAVKAGVNAIAFITRLIQGPCTHYGRTNHSVDTCFELHGLPDWWIEKHGIPRGSSCVKTTRGRGCGSNRGRGRGRNSYRANNAQVAFEDEFSDLPDVSKETWAAIKGILKSEHSTSHDKLSGKRSCVEFLLDSGASHYMTGDDDLLVDTHDIPQRPHFEDGVYHFRGAVSANVNHVKKSTRTLWHECLGHPSTMILSRFFYLF
ncbi:unnamed protein product [Arabidopsis halleri]